MRVSHRAVCGVGNLSKIWVFELKTVGCPGSLTESTRTRITWTPAVSLQSKRSRLEHPTQPMCNECLSFKLTTTL